MIDPKDVTIIIPHLGADEQQEYSYDQCLQSLRETFDGEILTIKNGIMDGVPQCKNHQCDLMIEKQGQNKAVNAAVATTNTPWIFITNDDMVYPPGWWEALTSANTNPNTNYMCISPMLVEPRPGAPTFEVAFCGGAGGDFDKQKWLEFAVTWEQERKYLMALGNYWTTGFNLPFLIRRDLWDTVGGYDINYDPWGSNGDSDLEYKIKLAGVQPYQNKRCLVYHFSQTSGTFEPRNDEYRFRNYAYFKEKWGFDRTDNGIWEATFEIPTKEEGRLFNPEWENKYK